MTLICIKVHYVIEAIGFVHNKTFLKNVAKLQLWSSLSSLKLYNYPLLFIDINNSNEQYITKDVDQQYGETKRKNMYALLTDGGTVGDGGSFQKIKSNICRHKKQDPIIHARYGLHLVQMIGHRICSSSNSSSISSGSNRFDHTPTTTSSKNSSNYKNNVVDDDGKMKCYFNDHYNQIQKYINRGNEFSLHQTICAGKLGDMFDESIQLYCRSSSSRGSENGYSKMEAMLCESELYANFEPHLISNSIKKIFYRHIINANEISKKLKTLLPTSKNSSFNYIKQMIQSLDQGFSICPHCSFVNVLDNNNNDINDSNDSNDNNNNSNNEEENLLHYLASYERIEMRNMFLSRTRAMIYMISKHKMKNKNWWEMDDGGDDVINMLSVGTDYYTRQIEYRSRKWSNDNNNKLNFMTVEVNKMRSKYLGTKLSLRSLYMFLSTLYSIILLNNIFYFYF